METSAVTPRERLLAVIAGKVPDTVPIFLRGVSPFGDKMNWMGAFDPSYQRLRDLAYEKTDIFHPIGLDTGVFLSAGGPEIDASVVYEDADWRDVESKIDTPKGPITSVTRSSKHNLYEVMTTEFFIESPDDLDRLMSIPYQPVRPDVEAVMSRKDKEVGERGVPVVSIPSAIGLTYGLLGSEGLAIWSALRREPLVGLVRELGRRVLDYVGWLLQHGAGPVFSWGGSELALPPLMSPHDFHTLVTEVDTPVHELIHRHSHYTWVHCHGGVGVVLDEFLKMGVDMLEPVEAPPGGDILLSEAKRRAAGRIVLMGNMPYEALISWEPSRIEEKVKADCQAAMEGGGFIMMPAASPFEPVLTDKGFEGYRTYVEAGRKYGRYA